ncbi:hypothetical protein GYMLUDRAFT_539153 [Collybiopsis luxurians FD-317 M1]|nr:hypothetical protein GYMLUDRAFT_539153 [Collybiopsis luxurians FD-317 M1]
MSRKGFSQRDISEDWEITSFEVDFESSDAIGQGLFGRVYKGRWNGTLVAIKQMHKADARSLNEQDREAMYEEVEIWTRLHHPNILSLYGLCLESIAPFMVMEYCQFGNVCDYLRVYPTANRIDLTYDIVAGMAYLHSRKIVHADLKGVNILVDDKHVARVADFGLSKFIDNIRGQSMESRRPGSVRWMAPECLQRTPPTIASDVYSLGISICEIFNNEEIPFADIRTDDLVVSKVINNRQRPSRPALLKLLVLWNLVQSCWEHEPERRPSTKLVQISLEPYTTRLSDRPQIPREFRKRGQAQRKEMETGSVEEVPEAIQRARPQRREVENDYVETQQKERGWEASDRDDEWKRTSPKVSPSPLSRILGAKRAKKPQKDENAWKRHD